MQEKKQHQKLNYNVLFCFASNPEILVLHRILNFRAVPGITHFDPKYVVMLKVEEENNNYCQSTFFHYHVSIQYNITHEAL